MGCAGEGLYDDTRSENSGQWTVDSEQWTVDSEQWTVNSGQWTVNSEQWSVDSGQWSVDREQGAGFVCCGGLSRFRGKMLTKVRN